MPQFATKRIEKTEAEPIDENDLGECTDCKFRMILHDAKYNTKGGVVIRCRKQPGRVQIIPKGETCDVKDKTIYTNGVTTFPIGFK